MDHHRKIWVVCVTSELLSSVRIIWEVGTWQSIWNVTEGARFQGKHQKKISLREHSHYSVLIMQGGPITPNTPQTRWHGQLMVYSGKNQGLFLTFSWYSDVAVRMAIYVLYWCLKYTERNHVWINSPVSLGIAVRIAINTFMAVKPLIRYIRRNQCSSLQCTIRLSDCV